MQDNFAIKIVLEEYDNVRTNMLAYQEQHKLMFGEENKACKIINDNIKLFADLLLKRIHDYNQKNDQ